MLKRVEGDNADRIVKLSRYQIGDDGFEVCPLTFGLPVDGAIYAEAIDDEVSAPYGTMVGVQPVLGIPTSKRKRNLDSSVISGVGCHYGRNSTV